jgi:hypothetical protein
MSDLLQTNLSIESFDSTKSIEIDIIELGIFELGNIKYKILNCLSRKYFILEETINFKRKKASK